MTSVFSWFVLGFLVPCVAGSAGRYAAQSPAQTAPQQIRFEIPPGWTVFRGQSGLIVPHPVGWSVTERGDGGFVAFCPGPDGGAMAVVYVQPIAKIEGRAVGVVQGLGQIAPDVFPGVQVARTRAGARHPAITTPLRTDARRNCSKARSDAQLGVLALQNAMGN